MAVRHCLMAGMCEAADEVEEMSFSTSGGNYGYECCGSTTRGTHHSSCVPNKISPAKFRCPATVSTSEHCERKWMEAIA